MVIVVADTSGSMREQGKAMLVRNLIACVREQERLSDGPWHLGESVVVLWGGDATAVELSPEQDLPQFPVGGRAHMPSLLKLLDRFLPDGETLRVLLLSDGHLPSSGVSAFKAWKRGKPDVSVRGLAVGPDATPGTLSKMTEPGGVFPPAEIVSALASWTLPRDPVLPTRVGDVAGGTERNL